MPDLIRSACLTHFAEVSRSVGLDPRHMLRSVGLPPTALQDPDTRIAAGGVRRLLEESASAADIDDFGLRLAARGGLSNLGPVALVVREQPTVGAALDALSRYIHIHNESIRLSVERHEPTALIAPVLLLGSPAPARQSIELTIGVAHRILAALLGPNWRPREVLFAHSAPRQREPYRRFFGCAVTFGAKRDAIVFPAVDLDHPMLTANEAMARYAQDYVDTIAARSPSIDGKVRELVAALLPTGRCSIDRVAEHFACDRRTIHRRLADCGTTYSEILDAHRCELVARLVRERGRSLPAVAELLGFSAQSALARWFRERFGTSISRWRDTADSKAGI